MAELVGIDDLAEAVGAKRPRRIPVWLARPAVGEAGISMMTQIRGSSNARAKRELGWEPAWATWREGFRRGLRTPVSGIAAQRAGQRRAACPTR